MNAAIRAAFFLWMREEEWERARGKVRGGKDRGEDGEGRESGERRSGERELKRAKERGGRSRGLIERKRKNFCRRLKKEISKVGEIGGRLRRQGEGRRN